MKRRILVLFLAVICIAALLSSCGEDCVHTDADRNHVCDNCSMPVVTIIEYTAAEEEAVETVIKPMPANVKFSDYILPETLEVIHVGTPTLAEKITSGTLNYGNNVYFISYTDEIADETDPENVVYTYTDTVKVYDAVSGKELYSFTTRPYSEDATDRDYVDLSIFDNYAFKVHTSIYNTEALSYTDTYAYYTLAGDKIGETDSFTETPSFDDYADQIIYIEFDGKMFAVDVETFKIIYSEAESAFVKRPIFTYKDEKYGFVRRNGEIFVFDLSSWLNCVYSYELPTFYKQLGVFYLADGKVLVQGVRAAANDTVNYDLLLDGTKTCVDYIVVDPVAKTATEIEFGYFINNAGAVEEDDIALATAKNVLSINRIVNRERTTKVETVYVDADFNIVLNVDANLPIFAEDIKYVAPGLYLAEIVYGENSRVEAIYNANGEQVCVLPSDYTDYGDFVLVDNVLYTWDMQKKLDLAEAGYSIRTGFGNSLILTKTNEETTRIEYFFYSATSAAPALIANNDTTQICRYSSNYVEITETVAVEGGTEGETKTTYKVYNTNMECVFTSEVEVTSFVIIEEGVYKIILADGSVYFLR